MKTRFLVGCLLFMTANHLWAAAAEDDTRRAQVRALSGRLKYQDGQIRLRDGLATINLPAAFRYLDPAGSETLLTGIWGNPSSGKKTLGTIVPASFDPFDNGAWCVIIQ